jgi:hypothetical protein
MMTRLARTASFAPFGRNTGNRFGGSGFRRRANRQPIEKIGENVGTRGTSARSQIPPHKIKKNNDF